MNLKVFFSLISHFIKDRYGASLLTVLLIIFISIPTTIAMLHEGKYVTVMGAVASTYIPKGGKLRFVDFAEDWRTGLFVPFEGYKTNCIQF